MGSEVDLKFIQHPGTSYINITEQLDYQCDGNEGQLMFDGYYYVMDVPDNDIEKEEYAKQCLPQTMTMYMTRYSTNPEDTETWFTEESFLGCISQVKHTKTKKLEAYKYTIEIYKRVKHEDTSRISEFEDEDGPARICFFPTHKQTIYFRILSTQNTLCTPFLPAQAKDQQEQQTPQS